MSTSAITIDTSLPAVLEASGALEAGAVPAAAKARAGIALSIATFAMAAASAIQAILYLGQFGTNVRTDGFFVAFALYTTFGVFSQSLRMTAVPLLVEPGARLSIRQFAVALGAMALPVLLVTGPLAGPVAQLLAPGLGTTGRSVTASALPVLGVAMTLQLWAAGGATVLAIRDRFVFTAGAYIAGAMTGLVAFLALMGRTGEQTLGWSMLAMAVVTCTWMLVGVQRSGGLGKRQGSLGMRATLRNAGIILGPTTVYLAFNMLFVVTLAFASHSAAGATTVLSYAYLFASYLVAGTAIALGMSRIPDMTRMARAERRAVVTDSVPQGFRYAMLLVAPAIAVLITAGASIVHVVLPKSLSGADAETLRTFAALLLTWTVAALLVSFLLPALLALGRARLLNTLAVPLVLVHIAATALGSSLFGVDGAVGAFFVAPAIFSVVLLVGAVGRAQSGALARELAADAARFLVLSAVAFGAGWLVSLALPAGLIAAVAAGAIGCLVYVAGLRLVARRQIEVLMSVVARPAAA